MAIAVPCGCGSSTRSGSPDASSDAEGPPPRGVSVAAGLFFTCGTNAAGKAMCWGYDAYGMLGNGSLSDSPSPVQVTSLPVAAQIAAGGYDGCALLLDRHVWCWGDNTGGQLGDTTMAMSSTPVAVPEVSDAVQVSVGTEFACALKSDGTAECWGANNTGQLGNGTLLGSPYFQGAPSPVAGLKGAVAVTAGGTHACALGADGTVSCWGDNEVGQLGPGSTGMNSDVPVAVQGLAGVKALSAGSASTCALKSDGSVWCWGGNASGELGSGSTSPPIQPTAVRVQGADGATAIAVGTEYACAVLGTGDMVCWGDNSEGTLGNGTTTSSPLPVKVSSLSGVVRIAAGPEHACAQLSDGSLACWGNNTHGQLGNPSMGHALVPVRLML